MTDDTILEWTMVPHTHSTLHNRMVGRAVPVARGRVRGHKRRMTHTKGRIHTHTHTHSHTLTHTYDVVSNSWERCRLAL